MASLKEMAHFEDVISQRVPNVKLVLIILSSKAMVFDLEALRQKVVLSYPDAAVYFQTPSGDSVGNKAPEKVDLLIDFTGPKERQKFRLANSLRRMSRVAVGRNSGWSRKRIYDRVFDETLPEANVPTDVMEKERFVQKLILKLAGVAVVHTSDTPPDLGKIIPLELPNLLRTTF